MLPLYSGVEIRTTSAPAISLAQAPHLAMRIVGVVVLVVVGEPVEALELQDLDSLGRELGRRAQQRRVVRRCAQASRDRQDSHPLCGLDRRHAHEQLDLVGHEEVAVRERLIPLEVELAAVDDALELEADALVAPRIGAALGDDAGQLDRLGDALDRDLAVQTNLAVVERLAGGGGEADLGWLLGVEEVGRRSGAPSRCGSFVSTLETSTAPEGRARRRSRRAALELAEGAADGGDSHVANLEADARVRGIDVVGAGRNALERKACDGQWGSVCGG